MSTPDFGLKTPASVPALSVPGNAAMTAVPYLTAVPADSEEEGGKTLRSALHSVRRHWVMIGLIGGMLAGGLSLGVWSVMGTESTATSMLRVAAKHNQILSERDGAPGTDFTIFKKTQRQLITGPLVLSTVLQREAIAKLPIVRSEVDQIGWMQKRLSVNFPDDAEIMLVSFRCSDRIAAETIVNEIVNVYLTDVVDVEHSKNQKRTSTLQKALAETDTNLRSKQNEKRGLAESLGASDSEALTLAQKNTLDEYAVQLNQLRQLDFEVLRKERELKLAEALADAAGEVQPTSDQAWQAALSMDPVLSELTRNQKGFAKQRERIQKTVAPEKATVYLQQIREKEEQVEKEIADRRALLEFTSIQTAIPQRGNIELEVQLLKQQRDEWKARVESHREAAEKIGRSSIDVEMLNAEIDSLSQLRQQLQQEYQQARLEAGEAKPRVSVVNRAFSPRRPDLTMKASASGGAGFLGFAAWTAIVVFYDLRKGRLNGSDQLPREVGLQVVGALPLLRSRRGRLVETEQLSESIDAVAATILCHPNEPRLQTVMITSAIPGEGKSTLAANLAKSLASAGRSTLLVDFDLRRPALHAVFRKSLEAGVAEVLDGTLQVEEVIRTTEIEGLAFISAGNSRLTSLSQLTDGSIREFFETVCKHFDYIVVDAAPVLPVVDSRLVARHVDGVLLSLLRDHSEVAKVASARSTLETFGARILGGVMIGNGADLYYDRLNLPVSA